MLGRFTPEAQKGIVQKGIATRDTKDIFVSTALKTLSLTTIQQVFIEMKRIRAEEATIRSTVKRAKIDQEEKEIREKEYENAILPKIEESIDEGGFNAWVELDLQNHKKDLIRDGFTVTRIDHKCDYYCPCGECETCKKEEWQISWPHP